MSSTPCHERPSRPTLTSTLAAIALLLSLGLGGCGGSSEPAQERSSQTAASQTSTDEAVPDITQSVGRSMAQPTPTTGGASLSADEAQALADINRKTLQQASGTEVVSKAASRATMYRFYNKRTGAHFYTISTSERDQVIATLPDYIYEGTAYEVYGQSGSGLSPVYRFYNTRTGTHVYTISEAEKNTIIASYPFFHLDGIAFYANKTQPSGMRPVYRFYHAAAGFHFFTASEAEKNSLVNAHGGYSLEGAAYFIPNPTLTCTPPQAPNGDGTACVNPTVTCTPPQIPNGNGTACVNPPLTCTPPLVPNGDGTACVNPPASLPYGARLDSRLTGRWQYITTFTDGTQYGSFYTFGANGSFDYTLIYNAPTNNCIAFRQAVAYHQGTYGLVGTLDDPTYNPGQLYLLDTTNYVDYTRCDGRVERVAWIGTQPHFHWAGLSGGLLYTNHTDDNQVANTGNLAHNKMP